MQFICIRHSNAQWATSAPEASEDRGWIAHVASKLAPLPLLTCVLPLNFLSSRLFCPSGFFLLGMLKELGFFRKYISEVVDNYQQRFGVWNLYHILFLE